MDTSEPPNRFQPLQKGAPWLPQEMAPGLPGRGRAGPGKASRWAHGPCPCPFPYYKSCQRSESLRRPGCQSSAQCTVQPVCRETATNALPRRAAHTTSTQVPGECVAMGRDAAWRGAIFTNSEADPKSISLYRMPPEERHRPKRLVSEGQAEVYHRRRPKHIWTICWCTRAASRKAGVRSAGLTARLVTPLAAEVGLGELEILSASARRHLGLSDAPSRRLRWQLQQHWRPRA